VGRWVPRESMLEVKFKKKDGWEMGARMRCSILFYKTDFIAQQTNKHIYMEIERLVTDSSFNKQTTRSERSYQGHFFILERLF
jgi:hypothetical protein